MHMLTSYAACHGGIRFFRVTILEAIFIIIYEPWMIMDGFYLSDG
jgi:hypothetical protein